MNLISHELMMAVAGQGELGVYWLILSAFIYVGHFP